MNKLRIHTKASDTSHPSVWLAYWNGAECMGVMVYTEMIVMNRVHSGGGLY